MSETSIYILTFLYGLGGIITFVGYFPTIRDLWHEKESANMNTYLIWTSTMIVASIYGVLILKDIPFIIVTNLNLAACSVILILEIRFKKSEKAESGKEKAVEFKEPPSE